MNQDRRGFRFLFDAASEIAPESSLQRHFVSVRATEISLHGCYLETPAPFAELAPVFVKIFYADEYFEAKGTVIYVKAAVGMGVQFRDVKPPCRIILQKWILAALQNRSKNAVVRRQVVSELARMPAVPPVRFARQPSTSLRFGCGGNSKTEQGHV